LRGITTAESIDQSVLEHLECGEKRSVAVDFEIDEFEFAVRDAMSKIYFAMAFAGRIEKARRYRLLRNAGFE
jgi:hypothetical protein